MIERLVALRELSAMQLRRYLRDPGAMFWTFGFPIVMSVLLGIAFRKAEPIVVAVAQSPSGERVEVTRSALASAPDMKVVVLSEEESAAALRGGRVSLVVVPSSSGYAYRFDPTRPESRAAHAVADEILQHAEGRIDAFVPQIQTLTASGSRYIDFLVPGLIGLGLCSSSLWGVGYSLVEMRGKKLLRRLAATPMRRSDFLLSFLTWRFLLLPFEIVPILVFARYAFDVPMRGGWGTLAIEGVAGTFCFGSMGLCVGCRTESTQVVSGYINTASFPMYLCSGVFFASSRFPDVLQPIIRLFPMTALNDAFRATILDGAPLHAVLGRIGVVAAWGLVSFVIALRAFKWR